MATGDKKRALMADDLNNAGSGYPVMPLKTVDSSPDASHTDNLISSAAVAAALADKADKTGLTDIFTTGSTNNSGGAIGAGVFFYKDGTLVQAKTAIASGATLTLNTNYEVPTAGALNALKSALDIVSPYNVTVTPKTNVTITATQFARSGHLVNYLVSFTTSVNMSLYNNLFTLSVKPKTNQSVELMTGIYIPSGKGIYIDTSGVAIVGDNALPAGTYIATGMYLAD